MIDMKLIRELTKRDDKTRVERALKLCEEAGEVAGAVLSETKASGCGYKNKTPEDILEEVADVFILNASIVADYGFTEAQVLNAIKRKCEKWEFVLSKDSESIKQPHSMPTESLSFPKHVFIGILDYIEDKKPFSFFRKK